MARPKVRLTELTEFTSVGLSEEWIVNDKYPIMFQEPILPYHICTEANGFPLSIGLFLLFVPPPYLILPKIKWMTLPGELVIGNNPMGHGQQKVGSLSCRNKVPGPALPLLSPFFLDNCEQAS